VSRSQYAPSSDNITRNDHSEVHDSLSLSLSLSVCVCVRVCSLYLSCVTCPTLGCICSVVCISWFGARMLVKYKLGSYAFPCLLVYFVEGSR
jgi:hypothetical protein